MMKKSLAKVTCAIAVASSIMTSTTPISATQELTEYNQEVTEADNALELTDVQEDNDATETDANQETVNYNDEIDEYNLNLSEVTSISDENEVIINSQTDWDLFLEGNSDWKKEDDKLLYIGNESTYTISINSAIEIGDLSLDGENNLSSVSLKLGNNSLTSGNKITIDNISSVSISEVSEISDGNIVIGKNSNISNVTLDGTDCDVSNIVANAIIFQNIVFDSQKSIPKKTCEYKNCTFNSGATTDGKIYSTFTNCSFFDSLKYGSFEEDVIGGQYITLNKCSFNNISKAITSEGMGNSPYSNGTFSLNLNNCNIKNCDTAIEAVQGKAPFMVLTINGGTIINENKGNKAIDCTNGTCKAVNIQNTLIDGYNTDIYCYFNDFEMDNTEIRNSDIGLDISGKYNISSCNIHDCENIAINIGHQTNDLQFLSVEEVENVVNGVKKVNDIQNTTINKCGTAIQGVSGCLFINKCNITEVNNGILNITPFILNSVIYGTNSTNSVGLQAWSNGSAVVGCKMNGFEKGVLTGNGGSQYIVDSEVKASKLCVNGYVLYAKGCIFESELNGLTFTPSENIIVDCKIKGKNKNGIGLDNPSGGIQEITSSSAIADGISPITKFNSLVTALENISTIKPHDENTEISNFDKGINDGNCHIADTKVYDCKNGMIPYTYYFYRNTEVSNCDEYGVLQEGYGGIYTNPMIVDNGMALSVHDCKIGVNSKFFQTNGNSSLLDSLNTSCYDIKVYNCETGIICDGTFRIMASMIKDCGTGIKYNENSTTSLCNSEITGNDIGIDIADNNSNLYLQKTSDKFHTIIKDNKVNIKNADTIDIQDDNIEIDGNKLDETYDGYLKIAKCGANPINGVFVSSDGTGYVEGKVIVLSYYQNDDKDKTTEYYNNMIEQRHLTVEKEGFIPTVEADDNKISVVLTEGATVTYDYKTNGGSAFSETSNMKDYKKGMDVDLTQTAQKEGYTFVGWNTDKNATDKLEECKIDTKNITLYAIYKKDIKVTYHDYNGDTYTQIVSVYNNETKKDIRLSLYSGGTDYVFVGYLADKNMEITDENDTLKSESVYEISKDVDLYSVYKTQSDLTYKHDGSIYDTDSAIKFYVTEKVKTPSFSFHIKSNPNKKGYQFIGWKDIDGNIYNQSDNFITSNTSEELNSLFEEIKAESIEVTPKKLTLYIGQDSKLTAKVLPEDALNKTVDWSSNDDSIVSVNEQGYVCANRIGTVVVKATTTDGSNLSDICEINVIEAKTESPTINISDTYKATIIPGSVENDEIGDIYYRINDGQWEKYDNKEIPMYGEFKIEAYQTTKERNIKSEISKSSGVEYADGIHAKYIGDYIYISDYANKDNIKVTITYPNSSPKEVYDFDTSNLLITNIGENIIDVSYKEYPKDENCPTLKTTVSVNGKKKERSTNIHGMIKYKDDTPISAEIIFEEVQNENSSIDSALYKIKTDAEGGYTKDLHEGNYCVSIVVDNKEVCRFKVKVDSDSYTRDLCETVNCDKNITNTVSIDEYGLNIVSIVGKKEVTETTEATTENTTENTTVSSTSTEITTETKVENKTPKDATKTGDNTPLKSLALLMSGSFMALIGLIRKKK